MPPESILSDNSDLQTWVYHLLSVQAEDAAQADAAAPLAPKLSTTHDFEPQSQPISPTSDSVDMHANLHDFLNPLLAFRPMDEDDLPESIASTIISDYPPTEDFDHTGLPLPSSPPFHDPTLHRLFGGIDFDHSCLDTLDEQLLFHPTRSFAATCWAEAVQEFDEFDEFEPTTPPPPPPTRCPLSFFDNNSQSSLETLSTRSDITATPRMEVWATEGHLDSEKLSSIHPFDEDEEDDQKHSQCDLIPAFRDDAKKPYGHLDGRYFTGCNPRDAIHFYPVSPLARQLRQADQKRINRRGGGLGRITAFCATLPRRLIHPVSAS